MRKKASMALSVNAIVVLVLAFALLGVGIVFVNFLKSTLFEEMGTALQLHDLKNPPTHDKPISFPDNINIKQNNRASFQVGFFNKDSGFVENVNVRISRCMRAGEEDPMDEVPFISGLPFDEVGPSEIIGANIFIDLSKEDLDSYTKDDYICTLQIYNFEDVSEIYESKSFFLTVS